MEMPNGSNGSPNAEARSAVGSKFEPQKPAFSLNLPGELWQSMLESHCTFGPEAFLRVMHNLIKNPNIMSSHLFRADIFYDSSNDHTIITKPDTGDFSGFTKHLKKDCRPIYMPIPGYEWQMTYVRQLVPRNRQLDKDLVQSCHFFSSQDGVTIRNLILYVPHITNPDEMPWYHPRVQQVAFLHEWHGSPSDDEVKRAFASSVSVHFCLFPDTPSDNRLERTALQLLHKIHKHGQGEQAGYIKRVHHDQIVPQQKFQNTYARLKAKYAKVLIENWVEATDPGKHVFEDLGIAAFLIELWGEMYDCAQKIPSPEEADAQQNGVKRTFPGFVDIGCGNGLLVSLLIQEGYSGWGFDARRRKTWQTFPSHVQEKVKEMVLVPDVLNVRKGGTLSEDDHTVLHDRAFHNGLFKPGTFIVSNHADELTPWTPLIAHLNDSPFIAIPCCSHNLAGARWRAPPSKSAPSQVSANTHKSAFPPSTTHADENPSKSQAAETGSLKKPAAAKNVPSAYASLCDYVSDLAQEVGFVAEKEMLRIPSTRNACILGRRRRASAEPVSMSPEGGHIDDLSVDVKPGEQHLALLAPSVTLEDSLASDGIHEQRRKQLHKILKRELNLPVEVVCEDWIKRAEQIAGKKGDGH